MPYVDFLKQVYKTFMTCKDSGTNIKTKTHSEIRYKFLYT